MLPYTDAVFIVQNGKIVSWVSPKKIGALPMILYKIGLEAMHYYYLT